MKTYNLYKISTGVVTSIKTVTDEATMIELVAIIGNPDRAYIEGRHEPEATYIKDGVAHNLPEKMFPYLTWNLQSEAWEDQRTASEIAAALDAARARKSLSRRELCLELKRRGVLTQADAILASRGEWPTVLQPFLDQLEALDASASGEVLIEWAGASRIDRIDTNIMVMASELGISVADVDDIFGVDVTTFP